MDTLLEKESFLEKLKKRKKSAALLFGAFAAIYFIFSLISTASVSADLIRTATVFRGDLNTEIEGVGTVKSTSLELHYSPVATYVKQILLREGQLVNKGDTILILDSSEIEKELASLQNQILIDQNNLRSSEIDFAQLELANERRFQLFTANLKQHEYEYQSSVRLQKIGGISESALKASEIEVQRDKIELSFLKKEQELNEAKLKQDIRTLRLRIENRKKELHFQQNRFRQTIVRASDNGALISQPLEAGEKVTEGQLISQISNLKDFVVEARFSQRHLSSIQTGMPATIRVNNKDYKASVSLVQLEIKNGYGLAEIKFEEKVKSSIRQSQTTQVFVQTGTRKNVLMIERGAFLNAGGNFAFVVTDNIAKRVTIQLGGRNYTHVEIKTGVNENDIIVVSRIDDFFDYDKFIIN